MVEDQQPREVLREVSYVEIKELPVISDPWRWWRKVWTSTFCSRLLAL